ncbi:MAG: hypothetical protein ACKPCI_00535 [Dolichospermum sp.]
MLVQRPGKSHLLTCRTILTDQDKINIKCFCQQDEEIRISLESLLSKYSTYRCYEVQSHPTPNPLPASEEGA